MDKFEKEPISENEISESASATPTEDFGVTVKTLGPNEKIEEILRKFKEEKANPKQLNLPHQEALDDDFLNI